MSRKRRVVGVVVFLVLLMRLVRYWDAVHPPTRPVTAHGVAPPGVAAADRVAAPDGKAYRADLDGDGLADSLTIVRWPYGEDLPWVGLRADLAAGGSRHLWLPRPAGPTVGRLLGTVDVDRDGRAEGVFAGPARRQFQLVTLHGDRLEFVTGAPLWTQTVENGARGWGCADGLVYTALLVRGDAPTAEGHVAYHRLDGTRLVEERTEVETFPRNAAPDRYGPRVRCGTIER